MIRFIAIALGAFLLPGLLYYLWRLYAPAALGGAPELAHGSWRAMPWRWLALAGLVCLVATFAAMVTVFEDVSAPPEAGGVPPVAR